MPTTVTRAMQVAEPGAAFRLVEVPERAPGTGEVRISVEACGVCRTDTMIVAGWIPGTTFPCTTGHEIAGRIAAVGEGVTGWEVGDRVAVGWYGGSDGTCDACREGDGVQCARLTIPGVAYPGGYADSVVVPAMALARVPEELTMAQAAPMGCAGVAAFNSLRRSSARPGDLVAILGLGGIGHLGVQFAAAMGFRVVALARGEDKAKLARELGAHHYIDTTTGDPAAELQELGGAKVIQASVTSGEAMAAVFDGLGRRGEMIVLGATTDVLGLNGLQILGGARRLYGHGSGTAVDVEQTMRFAAQTGVRPWIEEVPLEEAGAAVEKVLAGTARFRMVLNNAREV